MPLPRRVLLIAAALAAVAACNASPEAIPTIAGTQFAPSLGINLAAMTVTADDLYYQDQVAGNGEVVKPGTQIHVKYTGWLPDGTEFDASSAHGGVNGTFGPFAPDDGSVIQGWAEGIPGMAVGGTRLLIVPSQLAYGGEAFGPIPANAILVFSIQVVSAP